MIRVLGHFLSYSSIILVLVETSLFGFILIGLRIQPLFDELTVAGDFFTLLSAEIGFSLANFAFLSAMGYYNRSAFFSRQDRWRSAILAFPFSYALLCFVVFALEIADVGDFTDYYRIILVGLLLFGGFSMLWREAFRGMAKMDLFRRSIIVIGDVENARKIQEMAAHTVHSGYQVIGFLGQDNDHETKVDSIPVLPSEILQKRHELARYISTHQVDEIVVAYKDRRRPKGKLGSGLPIWELLECRLAGIRVSNLHDFWEMETGRINLDDLHPSSLIFSSGFRLNMTRNFIKRMFDIAVSLILLILFLPIMGLTALAVKLASSGPALYRQERVGLHGNPFVLMKFRSMAENAEEDGVPQWASANDVRVNPVGRFIRKTRLDELPQLFNVLKGEMSLVGPRPERPYFVDQLRKDIPYYGERHNLRPGVTGWAQVNYPYGASVEDAKTKLSYDIYYLKNHSLFLDIIIVLQTVRVILFAHGGR